MVAEQNIGHEIEINDPQREEFQRVLEAEDELGIVIRTHIHVESILTSLIERLIPYHEALLPMQLNYFQKVHLTIALGLKDEIQKPLLALGKLRNNFAHQISYSLTESVVENFYKSFPSDFKQIIHASNDKTRKKLGVGKNLKIKVLGSKDKFTLYEIVLRFSLVVAENQFDQNINA